MADEASCRLQAEKSGMPPWLIEAFSSLFRSIERNRFSEVSGDIGRLLGRQAEPFSSFLSSALISG
jgi:NAD(P)H dehydrogenase (quinone)